VPFLRRTQGAIPFPRSGQSGPRSHAMFRVLSRRTRSPPGAATRAGSGRTATLARTAETENTNGSRSGAPTTHACAPWRFSRSVKHTSRATPCQLLPLWVCRLTYLVVTSAAYTHRPGSKQPASGFLSLEQETGGEPYPGTMQRIDASRLFSPSDLSHLVGCETARFRSCACHITASLRRRVSRHSNR
jgi:hypothetical protein